METRNAQRAAFISPEANDNLLLQLCLKVYLRKGCSFSTHPCQPHRKYYILSLASTNTATARNRTPSAELWHPNETQRRTPTRLTSTHSVSLSIASATPPTKSNHTQQTPAKQDPRTPHPSLL